jgi:hypothetical protein
MEMPRPSAEHTKLHVLAGEWEGSETLSPSPWGHGGTAIGKSSGRLGPGGFFVIQDYVEEKGGQVVFNGHGVFGWDAEQKSYAWYWVDSMGFVPDAPARGQWVGDTLTFAKSTPRGEARYTYRFEGERTYHLAIENSFDGGATWKTFMSGTYHRK